MSQTYQILSPHLDDAALSCSLFLGANPGSSVITVFADGPESVWPLTPWDRAAQYFPEGSNVMAVRRGEDASAAAMVHASTCHLPYWDRQYRTSRYGYSGLPDDSLTEAIAGDLVRLASKRTARAWLIPLGLCHPDHLITSEAGLLMAKSCLCDVYLYEELPYAVESPKDVVRRKQLLIQRGYVLESDPRVSFSHNATLKSAVIRCHASQRRSLGTRRLRTATRGPERIWKLTVL